MSDGWAEPWIFPLPWPPLADSATQITATWTAVTDADGYVVAYTASSDTTCTELPQTTATSQAITGLTAETSYDVQVKAIGDGIDHADSPYSATQTATTPAA